MLNDENRCELEVILAEYSELKAEIRSRSKAQNNILQIHITALTAIIGFVAYQTLNPDIIPNTISFSILLLLIPLESSIFGIWYFDHAITIFEIGKYIQNKIEKRIETKISNSKIMRWESEYNNGIIYPSLIRHFISLVIVFITFIGPTLVSFLFLLSYYIWVLKISIVFESFIIMIFMISDVFLFLLLLFTMIYCIYKPIEDKMKHNLKEQK